MKRMIAILLTAVLLISAVPITAGAKEATVEQKFKLLLDDMEFEPDPYFGELDAYYYKELAQYPEQDPDWILIQGDMEYKSYTGDDAVCATLGNKFVYLDKVGTPFKLTYCIYDVKSGVFYDIIDAWDMDFENLRDTWDALPPIRPEGKGIASATAFARTYLIGDADDDGELTILDATRIQRVIAEIEEDNSGSEWLTGCPLVRGARLGNLSDYDRDGDFTILDATKLQRHIAELPNTVDCKLAWNERIFPYYGENNDCQRTLLVNSLDQLDLSKTLLINDPDRDAEKKIRDAYDDSFFEKNSLLILNPSLGSGSYYLTLKKVSIDKDGVLNVDFDRSDPGSGTADINERFICIELSKAFLDDVRDIKVNIDTTNPPQTVSTKLVYNHPAVDKGDDTVAKVLPTHTLINNFIASYGGDGLSNSVYPTDEMKEQSILLVGAYLKLPANQNELTVTGAQLDHNGVLTLRFTTQTYATASNGANPRIVLVEIPRDHLDEISSVKVELTAENDYYSALIWNRKASYKGIGTAHEMITSYSQLKEDNEDHQDLKRYIDKTDEKEALFDSYAYLLINVPLGTTSLTLDFADLAIDSAGVLHIYLTATGPSIGNAVENTRFLCIELSKIWLEESTDYIVDLRYIFNDEDTDYEYRAAKHPEISVADPSYSRTEATLITSRSQLDPLLEGHQILLDDYDEAFYDNHSILSIHYDLPSGSDLVQFNGVRTTSNGLVVDMLEYEPIIGTDDIKKVIMCIEVPADLGLYANRSVKVNHIRQDNDETITAAGTLRYGKDTPVVIPEDYAAQGYSVVPFTSGYSARMNNISGDSAWSPMLNSYRDQGLTEEEYGGIVSIITNPYALLNFIVDNNLDIGYAEFYGFNYEPCRDYDYDLRFFSEYSLVGIIQHYGEYNSSLSIDRLFKKNGTLYIDADFLIPYPGQEVEADYVCFVKVKKSEIEDCTAVTLGKLDALPSGHQMYNDFEYAVNDDGNVEIINYIGDETTVSVPSSINGKKVVAIGDSAFHSAWTFLKSVTIPDTVTALGDNIFYQCIKLESVSLPDSITSMGKDVFRECSALTSVDLPKKLDGIPEGIFYHCSKLTSFTYPDNPTDIGDDAFRLTALENVTIPNTVTKIGDRSFASCTYLESISIPDSVTSIGSQAFYYCSSLTDITMSSKVTSIGSYAFYACSKLEHFAIPAGVTRINYATFGYCTALMSITMSDNVTYIGEQAFDHCMSLPAIHISQNVQTIDISAFEKCISLKRLDIPHSCKTICAKAAKDCTSLESVYFANENLAGFEITPAENQTIGSSAFEGCTSLAVVSMPDTIKTIGSRAFYGCTSLGSIDLPGSVTAISDDTFNGCENLITVTQNNDGLTVKTVGDYAFRNCKSLRSVAFSDALTSIGDAAFRGCSSLSEVRFEENLKTIGLDAFLECTALKKITIPRSVSTIQKGAFGYTVDEKNYYVKLTDFTISGFNDTRAQSYAEANGIPFVSLDEE